jgi:hypothetical protein
MHIKIENIRTYKIALGFMDGKLVGIVDGKLGLKENSLTYLKGQ